MVSQPPRQRFVADHAPAALRHGDAADLGRAALARHFDAFDLHTRPPGGAPAVDHRVHSVPHQLDMGGVDRSEEHTSELQSLMRISYAVFCLKKKKKKLK